LLHDDVVDGSGLRRGQRTANVLFGNQASVLVGDFLYSRAFQLMVELNDIRILEVMANATNTIAEGEVLQLMNCNNPNITEADYMEVIYRKTAKLFEAGTRIAAIIANQSEAVEQALIGFGRHLGLAFQLIDDALDYMAKPEELGKNIGDDLAEGKPTLPLIYAMDHGSAAGPRRAVTRAASAPPRSARAAPASPEADTSPSIPRTACRRRAGARPRDRPRYPAPSPPRRTTCSSSCGRSRQGSSGRCSARPFARRGASEAAGTRQPRARFASFRPFRFSSSFPLWTSWRSRSVRVAARFGENLGPKRRRAGAGRASLERLDQPRRLLGREAAPPIADAPLSNEVRHPGRPLARPAALISPHAAETRLRRDPFDARCVL